MKEGRLTYEQVLTIEPTDTRVELARKIWKKHSKHSESRYQGKNNFDLWLDYLIIRHRNVLMRADRREALGGVRLHPEEKETITDDLWQIST